MGLPHNVLDRMMILAHYEILAEKRNVFQQRLAAAAAVGLFSLCLLRSPQVAGSQPSVCRSAVGRSFASSSVRSLARSLARYRSPISAVDSHSLARFTSGQAAAACGCCSCLRLLLLLPAAAWTDRVNAAAPKQKYPYGSQSP